jgi:hypothetical protein
VETDWGDGLQGLQMMRVVDNLIELERAGDSAAKNWRPQVRVYILFDLFDNYAFVLRPVCSARVCVFDDMFY